MLVFVPVPIGNIEDISLRALKCIQESHVILCEDTRVTSFLISLLVQRGWLESVSPQLISVHSHNEEAFLQTVEPSFFEQNVLYMSDAGMPCVSDPGCALVRYMQANCLPYTVLPGANALLTAFAASGSVDKGFFFYGFLPHKQKQKRSELHRLLALDQVVILYESPHRLVETLNEIANIDPCVCVFMAKELTKRFERYYQGSVQEVLEQILSDEVRGEWVIVLFASHGDHESVLNVADLASLELPPKIHAKILAKMQNRSVKECYQEIIAASH